MSRNWYEACTDDRIALYAQRIRDLREDHDLTQQYVASMLNVEQRTYSDYEHGKIRLSIEALITLAEFYDVDMNYICGLTKRHFPFPKEIKNK